jgi:dihydroflavonol-4-reductase
VGGNLVRALLERGYRVRALARQDRRPLEGLDLEMVDGDVSDPASLERAFSGADRVFHLAARISIAPGDEEEVHRVNVLGVRNVVAACLKTKVKRLLHMSSIHAMAADPLDQPIDEQRPLATGDHLLPYDKSKAAGEREIIAGIERGLDAVRVNPTAILGPYDYRPSRMGEVLLDLYYGRLPALVEGGFDWVDVRDIVDGAIAAAEKGKRGDKFLLSGERRTIRELAALAQEITSKSAPWFTTPMWLARAAAPFATAYAKAVGRRPLFTSASLHALRNHQFVSHEKATRELGYNPRPLRETLQAAYDWFGQNGYLAPRD